MERSRAACPATKRRAAILATLAGALAAAGPALVAPGALAAQRAIDDGRAVPADAYIKIWNGAGSVRVEGWSADSLDVKGVARTGRLYLGAREGAAKLAIEGSAADAEGELRVRVPAGATVWVRTTGADIVVRGLTGSVDVHSVTGDVDVEGAPTSLYAESMGGDLRLRIDAGVVRGTSGSGRVEFAGSADDLTLSTVSGAIDVEARSLRRARLSTVDGDATFAGSPAAGGAIVVETHSGDIAITVPAAIEAAFELSTFEGRIASALGAVRPRPAGAGRTVVRFETGTAGAEVAARSYSGSVDVRADP